MKRSPSGGTDGSYMTYIPFQPKFRIFPKLHDFIRPNNYGVLYARLFKEK